MFATSRVNQRVNRNVNFDFYLPAARRRTLSVRQRADRTPRADYRHPIMVTRERSPQADVIEEILDRICVVREEMLRIQRKLERVKSDDSKEKLPNVKPRK
jgi:hypothetical protein